MLKVILMTLGMGVCAWANDLKSVTPGSEHGHFTATYSFEKPVTEKDVTVQYHENGVEFKLAGVKLLSDKNLIRVDSSGVKSILSVKEGEGVRTKVFLQESIDPSSVENSVRWKLNDSTLTVMMKKPGEEWSMAALGMDVVAPKAIDEEFAKAVAAATAGIPMTAPAPVQATVALPEDKPTVEVKPAAERNSKPVAEKDIPVLTASTVKTKASSNAVTRVVLSLLIIAGLAFGAVAFTKWYSKTSRKDIGNNKIRVLTQHHLGPRKSLAIIRVAGETILIGVTDHNISPIKSLSLLDDHMPDLTPKDFSETMQQRQAADKDDPEEDFIIGSIKDRVTTKIKSLRPLG